MVRRAIRPPIIIAFFYRVFDKDLLSLTSGAGHDGQSICRRHVLSYYELTAYWNLCGMYCRLFLKIIKTLFTIYVQRRAQLVGSHFILASLRHYYSFLVIF